MHQFWYTPRPQVECCCHYQDRSAQKNRTLCSNHMSSDACCIHSMHARRMSADIIHCCRWPCSSPASADACLHACQCQKTSLREDHSQRFYLLQSVSILYQLECERHSCEAFVESVLFTIVCTSLVRDILRSRLKMSGSMFPGESWLPRCL